MKGIRKWLPLLAALTVATMASAASPKMTCTLTGKEVKTCCCQQQKNGKLLCKLAKKDVDTCCCKGMYQPAWRREVKGMADRRKNEVFTAGSSLCQDTLQLVSDSGQLQRRFAH